MGARQWLGDSGAGGDAFRHARSADLRPQLIAILKKQIGGLKPLQAPSAVAAGSGQAGAVEETSSTAMFADGFARAVHRGWLPASDMAMARHAFAGIAQNVTADGVVRNTCAGTGSGRPWISISTGRTPMTNRMAGGLSCWQAPNFDQTRRGDGNEALCLTLFALLAASPAVAATRNCDPATQNKRRARALDVPDKSERVYRYQQGTVADAVKMMAAMGCRTPADLTPHHLRRNVSATQNYSYAELYEWLRPGELLDEPPRTWLAEWEASSASHFGPTAVRGAEGIDDGEVLR